MGRRVMFTEAQMEHIMECNGVDPKILQEDGEGGGATGCSTAGDYSYTAPGFDTSDDKFWGDSLDHQGNATMKRKK